MEWATCGGHKPVQVTEKHSVESAMYQAVSGGLGIDGWFLALRELTQAKEGRELEHMAGSTPCIMYLKIQFCMR